MVKKVLLLTQWFDPEPTFKGLLFAKELISKGFDVEVVTGFPNYPGGRVYDGYKISLINRQVVDGVSITRLALFPSHDSSAIKRILNYISFATTSLFYGLFFAKRADVIYAYHPPLTIGIVAVFLRLFRKIPIVYDIQDMWPDTLQATGMLSNKNLLSLIGKVAKWVYAHVDAIVVLSPGFKQLLIERGVPQDKITIIPNWCDEEALNTTCVNGKVFFGQEGKFNIIFAGNIGKAQALDIVINAAQVLQKQGSSVIFHMIGGGLEVDRLKDMANGLKLNNVEFIPQVPMSQIGGYLQAADALLVHLKKDPLFSITVPSKIQAYLSIGKPILSGVEGDAADIVLDSRAGIVFEPENVNSFVKAIISITSKSSLALKKMGFDGKNYYTKNLSLETGVNSFGMVFKSVLRR